MPVGGVTKRVQYSYTPTNSTSLAVTAGEDVEVMMPGELWTYVRSLKTHSQGYVPTSYLQDLPPVVETVPSPVPASETTPTTPTTASSTSSTFSSPTTPISTAVIQPLNDGVSEKVSKKETAASLPAKEVKQEKVRGSTVVSKLIMLKQQNLESQGLASPRGEEKESPQPKKIDVKPSTNFNELKKNLGGILGNGARPASPINMEKSEKSVPPPLPDRSERTLSSSPKITHKPPPPAIPTAVEKTPVQPVLQPVTQPLQQPAVTPTTPTTQEAGGMSEKKQMMEMMKSRLGRTLSIAAPSNPTLFQVISAAKHKPEDVLSKMRIIENRMLRFLRWKKLRELAKSSPEYRDARTRKNLIDEIYTTEVSYINALGVAVNVFLVPMQQKKLLKEEAIATLFGTIEQILQVQKVLLLQLETEVKKDSPKIGQIFKSMAPFLKLYTDYVNNYDNAQRLYEEQIKKKSKFNAFLEKNFANPACMGLNLPGFLIQPVQRIPRYRLLLQDVVKKTPPDHVDYKNLNDALNLIIECANFVNERKRQSENAKYIEELNQKLQENVTTMLFQPHRAFIRKATFILSVDYMTRDGKKPRSSIVSNLPYEMYFFNDMILLLPLIPANQKKKEQPFDEDDILVAFLAFTDMRHSIDEASISFELNTIHKGERAQFRLNLENNPENNTWVELISDCIEKTKKNICSKLSVDEATWGAIPQTRFEAANELPRGQETLNNLQSKRDVAEKEHIQLRISVEEHRKQLEELKKIIQDEEKKLDAFTKLLNKYSETAEATIKNLQENKTKVVDTSQKILFALNNDEFAFQQTFNDVTSISTEGAATSQSAPLL